MRLENNSSPEHDASGKPSRARLLELLAIKYLTEAAIPDRSRFKIRKHLELPTSFHKGFMEAIKRLEISGAISVQGDLSSGGVLQQIEIGHQEVEKLGKNFETCYSRTVYNRLLRSKKERMSARRRRALKRIFNQLTDGQLEQEFHRICKEYPDLASEFSERTNSETPKWQERTTGRKVSPIDWIRMYYGKVLEDGSWDPDGLRRGDLKDIDFPLYQAFSKWITRHPEDAFDGKPQSRPRYQTPEEALAARRESERLSGQRYRESLRQTKD